MFVTKLYKTFEVSRMIIDIFAGRPSSFVSLEAFETCGLSGRISDACRHVAFRTASLLWRFLSCQHRDSWFITESPLDSSV